MRKNLLSKIFSAAIFVIVSSVVFCGCSFNGGHRNSEYVSGVDQNINQAVNLTRILHEQQASLNSANQKSIKECVETLDSLSDIYSNIITLEPTDRYDDLDEELKPSAESALKSVSKLKILLSSASSDGNYSDYVDNEEKIMEEYYLAYEKMIDISSQVKTRFRND